MNRQYIIQTIIRAFLYGCKTFFNRPLACS